MLLHLNWTAAVFWAFLIFCKKHYQFHNYTNEIDFFLSIRKRIAIGANGFLGAKGMILQKPDGAVRLPRTSEYHIQLREKIKIVEMSEKKNPCYCS